MTRVTFSLMISSLCWIPLSVASAKPKKYALTEAEYDRIMNMTKTKTEEARTQMQQQMEHMNIQNTNEDDGITSKYNMDDYDEEELNGTKNDGEDVDESFKESLLSKVDDLIDDENIGPDSKDDGEEESDVDDITLRSSDRIIVCGRTEDDVSYLDMYIYDESDDHNLYVHHDIMLPSFPLCVQPINFSMTNGSSDKNFVAVGSFEADIEVWNMDIIDVACPVSILKGHKDAVMSLSWNAKVPNILASGSVDNSVIIWNLEYADDKCAVKRIKAHKDKVQCVQWNPNEPHLLATASYDKTVNLIDARSFEKTNICMNMSADPECLRWNPFAQNELLFSDENGSINFMDVRSPFNYLKKIEAHQKACSVIDVHPVVPGLLLSASVDRSFKVWDIQNSSSCLLSREADIGKIFTASFASDSPFIVACAGSRGELKVSNIDESDQFRNFIKARLS